MVLAILTVTCMWLKKLGRGSEPCFCHVASFWRVCSHLPLRKWSESHSVMSNSLWPHGLYSPWNSPGQNTGVDSSSLLQWIFPNQGSNPGLPHCRWILDQLSQEGSPRILEWVAYPFSSGSTWPRRLGSPALPVNSLPTVPSEKLNGTPEFFLWQQHGGLQTTSPCSSELTASLAFFKGTSRKIISWKLGLTKLKIFCFCSEKFPS